MCSRSSTCLPLPWLSSRGRLSARRSALGWILHSSHPLLLVGVLLSLHWFTVDPPLLLSPLSSPSAPLPWLVTPLPPLCPRPCLVPRVQLPWLLPCLMCWMRLPSWPITKPVWPLPPTFFCRRCPNALPLPFPPLSTLHLMPMVLWGSRLPPPLPPIPCVPITHLAGLLAGSTLPGTPPPFGHTPTPSPPLLPPLSSRPHFRLRLRSGSWPALTARRIPRMHLIAASTYATFTFQCSPLTPALSHLVPLSHLPSHLVPIRSPTFPGPTPLLHYLVPTTYASYLPSLC